MYTQHLGVWFDYDLYYLRDFIHYNFLLLSLNKNELLKHCQRQTRGTEATIKGIQNVLDKFRNAVDEYNTPLFLDTAKLDAVWKFNRQHVKCLQDPKDMNLYEPVGKVKKGSVSLPIYHCVRGTNSTEGWHSHQFHHISGKFLQNKLVK